MDFEKYLDEMPHFNHIDRITRIYMLKMMIAAYNQALEDAAEKVMLNVYDPNGLDEEPEQSWQFDNGCSVYINKQSILSLKKILINE